jgi:hypothetical protein
MRSGLLRMVYHLKRFMLCRFLVEQNSIMRLKTEKNKGFSDLIYKQEQENKEIERKKSAKPMT